MVEAQHPRQRLASIDLDTETIGHGTPDQVHERRTAIEDLLERNSFAVPGHDGGPYGLTLSIRDSSLVLDICSQDGAPIIMHVLSLRPLRPILRDYIRIFDSYVAAVRGAPLARIEAIDMGRRGLHDEGAERLAERLDGKISADFATMRRLFTLLVALHWKG